jgi:hypothetical protein
MNDNSHSYTADLSLADEIDMHMGVASMYRPNEIEVLRKASEIIRRRYPQAKASCNGPNSDTWERLLDIEHAWAEYTGGHITRKQFDSRLVDALWPDRSQPATNENRK